jgi:hypothetical protein
MLPVHEKFHCQAEMACLCGAGDMKKEEGKVRMKKRKEEQMAGENFLSYSYVNFVDPIVMNGGKNDSR